MSAPKENTRETVRETIRHDNGDVYDGEINSHGKYHGRGKYSWRNSGNIYEGEFKDGNMHGKGIMKYDKYNNGYDVYEGNWIDNKKNGQGIMTYDAGYKYDGEWKNDKKNGEGIMTWNDGKLRYKGSFARDYFVKGTFIDHDDNVYTGTFFNNDYTGKGTMEYKNGDKYEGNWDRDEKNGQGTMKYINGDEYEGNWINNKKNGKGIMKYKNGDVYDGEWRNDQKHGQGKMTYNTNHENKYVYTGEWRNDQKNGQGKLTNNGNVVYHGKWDMDNQKTTNYTLKKMKNEIKNKISKTFKSIKALRKSTTKSSKTHAEIPPGPFFMNIDDVTYGDPNKPRIKKNI